MMMLLASVLDDFDGFGRFVDGPAAVDGEVGHAETLLSFCCIPTRSASSSRSFLLDTCALFAGPSVLVMWTSAASVFMAMPEGERMPAIVYTINDPRAVE